MLFFTGLSGSGKSTLARALMDRLLEQGTRTVTTLDGDVVRRNLSAGLSFSKADRETNIRRIGWVAAEISRHGGVAVCSPIAPFDETRQQVRAMVDEAGGAFFLVHVATPLEECERRDRKGLYAKARRGEIPEFTGISSPYEEPADADVVVDTTGRTIDDALADVLDALRASGHLDLDRSVGRAGPGGRACRDPRDRRRPAPSRSSSSAPPTSAAPPSWSASPATSPGPTPPSTFTSAGTHGFAEHAMDEVMATTLGPRGVADHDTFRSRPLTRELLDEHDLVLTAEAAHRAFILDDHPALFRKVFTLGQFAEAVRTVGAGLTGRKLLTAVAEQRGTASADLDVADPYRRGPDAAEAAAAAIETHLRHIVPALTGAEPRA